MNTENNYQATDLGNISPNPRGDYDASASYEYLDLVNMDGGSYICLAELGTTVTGVSPEPGKTTETWQCIALPGDLTPEYIAMHDDVVNKAESVAEDTKNVTEMHENVTGMESNVQELQKQAAQSAEEAEASKDAAAGYARAADASRQAAEESEANVNAQVTGFDSHVAEKTAEAEGAIVKARQAAVEVVSAATNTAANAAERAGSAASRAEEAKTAAAGSETNAAASASAAKTSETNAKTSEEAAKEAMQAAQDAAAGVVADLEQIGGLKSDLTDIETVGFDVYKSRNIFKPTGIVENSWLLLDGTINTPSPYGNSTSVYSGSVESGHTLFMTYQQSETIRDTFVVSRYVFEDSDGNVIGSGGSTLMDGVDIPDGATIIKILFNTRSLDTNLQMEYDSVSKYMEYGKKILLHKKSDITADAVFFVPRYIYVYSGTMRYIDKMNVISSNSDDLMYLESPKDDPSRGIKDKICAIYGVAKIDVKSKITDDILFSSREIGIIKMDATTKSNPSSTVNVMMIGDSYTANSILPCDIKNQLVNIHGFTNYNFVGVKNGNDNGITCNHEGRAGYSIADYLKINNNDGRGSSFPNPYLKDGSVSIKNYCDDNSIDYPNVFIIELGINDIENGLIDSGVCGTLNERVEYLVDLIHSEFPTSKILLVGVVYTSINNGQGSYVTKNKNRMEYNSYLESLAQSDTYRSFTKYCDVGALFDTTNGYEWNEKETYRGSTVIEKEISDWLHPCRAGYYMESDCIVPALLDFNIN